MGLRNCKHYPQIAKLFAEKEYAGKATLHESPSTEHFGLKNKRVSLSAAKGNSVTITNVNTSASAPDLSTLTNLTMLALVGHCKGIFIFPFPFVSAVFYTCLLSRVWVSGVLLLTHFTIVISQWLCMGMLQGHLIVTSCSLPHVSLMLI